MSRKRNTKIRTPMKGDDFATALAETMKGTKPMLIAGWGEGVGFKVTSQMGEEMEMAFCHYMLSNCAAYRGMTTEEYVFKLMRKYESEDKTKSDAKG